MLREEGLNAFVIVGGLTAWRKAGNPLEPVPGDDLVKAADILVKWAEPHTTLGQMSSSVRLERARQVCVAEMAERWR